MTTSDYEQYEHECANIRQENAQLLAEFAEWLAAKGLSAKTVTYHRQNMDFYLNHFLLSEDAVRAKDGSSMAGLFLGYWFIRKTLCSSRWSLTSAAASLKKFYTFMVATSRMQQEDLDFLNARIKEGMPEWLATLARYNNPNITDPAVVWGL